MYRTRKFTTIILALCFLGFFPDDWRSDGVRKTTEDSDRNFTTAGSIGLTISNFGTIGTRNSYWPEQPSCEYPLGSRIEHLYQGGLWVGALVNGGEIHVSTGATDRSSASRIGESYEFTAPLGSNIFQRSTLSESQFFDENAISHQDFVADFTDRNRRNPSTGDTIPEHTPMKIDVHQESYAWNFPFADFFVILNYTIQNTSVDTLDSVYVGFWNNAVIRNTNNVRPGTPGYFDHDANGFVDSLRMMYTFDFDGIPTPPPADSYLGIKLLGTAPFPKGISQLDSVQAKVYYNAWRFRSSSGDIDYFSPDDDASDVNARSRYNRLRQSLPRTPVDKIAPLRTRADNMTTLLSVGPFQRLFPGDTLNVVFGVVCARKFGTSHAMFDTPEQRKTLYSNANFCQQAYDGEDINGNNLIDPGEDLNGNGRLDHYQLPQPPRPPKVRTDVANEFIAVYWDKSSSEFSVDPITREMDFEGYRVYRSNAGADFTSPENLLLTLTVAGEFDVPGNNFGFNTGFGSILLPQAKFFPDDTVAYWYRFPPEGANVPHLNGWQYLYGVSAFDRGDSASGITALESKREIRRAVAGTPPARSSSTPVGVYPNPYYANAAWDGSGERNRKIYFYNLPERCEIRIYTLAGDVIDDIRHDSNTYDGSDIEWFQRFGGSQTPLQFAGGEHAWDFISKFDQVIATGLYLYSVRNADSGEIQTGKFLIVK
ncbi:MAG TPA: hypothetical protein VGB89_09915 [Bacteroidota bacterium]